MRTKYSFYNLLGAIIGQFLGIVAQFASRRIFIICLNQTYLGVSGLFSNILSVLSLMELGAGVAMTYSLYKPIAENQRELIKSLMRFYHKIYVMIGVAILIVGFAITPIYPYFIAGQCNIPHLTIIYWIFVINTAVTYFFSYKRTLIICDQRRYIYSLTHYGMYAVGSILQIIALLLTKNYIIYLLCLTISTLLENAIITGIANKKYPYLKDKNVEELPKDEIGMLKKNIGSMLMHKIGGMVVSSTDNIIVSAFVGLNVVGIYSNYLLITDALSKVAIQFFQAITASIGNLLVEKDTAHINKVFQRTFFIGSVIYGTCTVAMLCGFQSFIDWYAGGNYLLEFSTVILICISFYVTGIRKAVLTFRDASATYYYDRYKAIAEAVMNLVLSIAFVKYMGIDGVILGTILSAVSISLWIEPLVLYKHILKDRISLYFINLFVYAGITLIIAVASLEICRHIIFSNMLLQTMERIVFSILFYLLMYCTVFWRKEEMQYCRNLIINKVIMRKHE